MPRAKKTPAISESPSKELKPPKGQFQSDIRNISYAMTKQEYDRINADRTMPLGHVIKKHDTRKNVI